MHELSLCQNIIRQLQALAQEHQASRVSVVRLKIGPLSGVDYTLLHNAFPVASADTVAEKAELQIENTAIRIVCQNCNKESDGVANKLLCKSCGSNNTRLLSGNEMMLVDVEFLK